MNRLAILGLLASLVLLPACPGKNKDQERCEKLADKTFAMAREMGKAMAKMVGAEKAAELEKKMNADMAKDRPEIVAACVEAIKKDPAIVEVMDCMMTAPDLEAASKCDPEGKMKQIGPKPGAR